MHAGRSSSCPPALSRPACRAAPPAPPAAFAHRLATGREPVLTGSVVGVLYAVGRLAGMLSLLTLAYLAVVAAFVLPKVGLPWGLPLVSPLC